MAQSSSIFPFLIWLYPDGYLSSGLARPRSRIIGDGFPYARDNDGTVDAADYVVWRNGLGTTYTQNDYGVWRAHFGSSLGSGSGAALPSADPLSASVPEPATLVMLVLAAAGIYSRRRRAA